MPTRTPLSPATLTATIDELILGRPMPSGKNLLGIEYERLILRADDDTSAPLEFCREFMATLCERFDAEPLMDGEVMKGLRADRFEMSMEPGGQLEVACAPVEKLSEVEEIMQRVDAVLLPELEASGYALRGLGHAPVTPVEELGLLPRERYEIMNRLMPARGPLSRNMMRATAGFQLTYDIEGREDAARKLALLYRLAPVFVALAANSRQIAGEDSGDESYRHRVWWETDYMRSGVPAGCMHAATAIEGYIRYAREAQVLFLTHPEDAGRVVEAPGGTLEELCAAGRISKADVELHLTSLFPFVRLRNYIEVRCLDSIEWDFARGMLGLLSGIVYCPDATTRAEKLSEILVIEDADALRDFHLTTAKYGLGAIVPGSDGVTLRDLASQLTDYACATLGGASCEWAEVADLDVVRSRIDGRH